MTGPIPTELGYLKKWIAVNFHYNDFTSTVPTELGLMSDMNDFFISDNSITGPIPTEFGLWTSFSNRMWMKSNQMCDDVPAGMYIVTRCILTKTLLKLLITIQNF